MAMLAELLAPDGAGTALADPAAGRVVASRFGAIVVRRDAEVSFPNGLLGFGALRAFGLASLPDERYRNFLVLQSLEDDAVAFLVRPLDPDAGPIASAEIADACATLGIPRDDLALVLIVSVRRQNDKAMLTVNLRAPLFIHAERRRGVQYVMPNGSYPIRYVL